MALSQSDCYSLAKTVGLTDSAARVAAAIAMPESGGDPNAHNTNAATGDNSYGIWQINMLGDMGPERRRLFGIKTNEELFNPQTNAKAMKILSQDGREWSPWSTYKRGEHLKYLNNQVSDTSGDSSWLSRLGGFIDPLGINRSIAGGLSSADDAVKMAGKAAVWMSDSRNWIRVVYVVGGSVLVIVGVMMTLESTKAGKAATRLATKGLA